MVQPVAKAVGSDFEPASTEEGAESALISGRRLSDSGELPLFDFDDDDKLDVPTFLRRQAD